MQCKSLWIKASAKCINVNVNVTHAYLNRIFFLCSYCSRSLKGLCSWPWSCWTPMRRTRMDLWIPRYMPETWLKVFQSKPINTTCTADSVAATSLAKFTLQLIQSKNPLAEYIRMLRHGECCSSMHRPTITKNCAAKCKSTTSFEKAETIGGGTVVWLSSVNFDKLSMLF